MTKSTTTPAQPATVTADTPPAATDDADQNQTPPEGDAPEVETTTPAQPAERWSTTTDKHTGLVTARLT